MQAQQQTPVQPSYAEYQANLKVTNKYAERFGLIDKPTAGLQTRNVHMHSFGNEIYPQARAGTEQSRPYEPIKINERASHNINERSQKSFQTDGRYNDDGLSNE